LEILQERVLKKLPISIKTINEDVDIRSLDENHVVPNIGEVVGRGLWFPVGYW
jgi:hypothetical protein